MSKVESPHSAALLKAVSYFSEVDSAALNRVAQSAIPRTYDAGQVILIEGEPCTGLYVVESGWLKVVKIGLDGRERCCKYSGRARSSMPSVSSPTRPDELGMMEDESNPLINGLVTFGSFVAAGAVPLLIYLLGLAFPIPSQVAFPASIALSGLALFGLGAAKVMVTKLNPIRSGLEMLIVGGLAAGVAYVVGALLKGIGG